jgi:hypothetical protein
LGYDGQYRTDRRRGVDVHDVVVFTTGVVVGLIVAVIVILARRKLRVQDSDADHW